MTAPACVRCDRPAPDGHACTHCGVTKPTGQLQQLADMTGAARDIARGFSRRTTTGTTGKPGPQLPLDLGATSRLDAVQTALTAHIDHIGTIRGITRPWFQPHTDPIVAAAEWLTAHGLEWMRHRDRDDVARFLTDIDTCARIVAGIARGPTAQKYLGPCGAVDPIDVTTFGHPPGSQTMDGPPCEGDVYAREGASVGRCRTCGAEVSTADRRAWLDAEVRSHAYRAAEIAGAYPINANTIRSWAHRGMLREHARDRDDKPLYLLGDVLDLATADITRRAANQTRRATRKDTAA
jgi:hypothetical protein